MQSFADPPVAPPGAAAHRYAWGTLALYALWAAVAGVAHHAGAAVLESGSGLILATGIGLTLGVFLLLARLPAVDQPALSSMVTAQALMGIVWTTLYSHFATGATLLATGMSVTAVLYALPVVSGPVLAGIGLAALAAGAGRVLLGLAQDGRAGLSAGLLGLAVLAIPVMLAVAMGRRLAMERSRQQERWDELRQALDRSTRRADRDQLTNSYSRRFIVEMLGREKARSDRSGEGFCVLLMDIDHFKDINDRHGHLAGDRILASFTRRVRAELRDMDSVNRQGAGQSSLGRYGGEEFIVVLPQTSMRGALRAAERIRKAVVRQPFEGAAPVTVSIGIAEYRAAESVSDLLARADGALYAAKNGGRNRVHCATRDGGGSAVIMPEIPRAS